MPSANNAIRGRSDAIVPMTLTHALNGQSLLPPFANGLETAILALGCFWGAERLFWSLPGVRVTAVGYSGGYTENPTYREVCTGNTGHTEVVLVVYDPAEIDFETVLSQFWEAHDPTQGMRQGGDVGTQYRSAIYTTSDSQQTRAQASRDRYQQALNQRGLGEITTEIAAAGPFYYAEVDHQQYLHKNPAGYCGLRGTGVVCPV
ncbi:peptide-methionine (S)-S-oxide reductase MsrA [Gammaproteobacteria bacterium]|nr:peptide-methionine (S)-S-oxide reductase MsrA [Gammaproteobacteria bacterium]